MNYIALKAEIQSGPLAATLAPLVSSNDTHSIANALNAVGPAQVGRKLVPSYEVLGATDAAEWSALLPDKKQLYDLIIKAGHVDLSNPNTRSMLSGLFGNGPTRTAIIALNNRAGSRSEALGFGTVTALDVAQALRT